MSHMRAQRRTINQNVLNSAVNLTYSEPDLYNF
jgi:hypothetical protein